MSLNCKNVMREEFLKMHMEVSCMHNNIEAMKTWLQNMKEQNNRCRELLSLMKSLNERIIHMEKNVAPELIHAYQENNKNILHDSPKEKSIIKSEPRIKTEKHGTPMIDCKKILFDEPEVYPIIPLLTEDEFSTVPKYIIGRQSLDTVNNLISAINQVLKAKYMFLSLGKAHARKQGNLNLYLHYKKQELDICSVDEYIYFFTAEDYERETKSKLNKIKLNLLTVLRHCKRLREYRVKNDVRYVVLTK
ncbi:SKA complex subunit 1 isoform X2 [Calliopsis andreniformis]|uniref:SKA complex subunit 1 isoform X2 n=1 Tax=Calliopsis andreniformis TaxID=337506 RepID=UPI003FCDF194